MKLTNETVKVLKNFSAINQSLHVEPGHELETISSSLASAAVATIPDDFKKTFTVYDLNRFLSVLSLFDDPVINFHKNHCEISPADDETTSKVFYKYCNKNVIVSPSKKLPDMSKENSFTLKSETLEGIMKAAAVLSSPNIGFIGEGGKLIVKALDISVDGSDNYSLEVGDTDKEFESFIKTENMQFLANDYEVRVARKAIQFISDKVTYWVACETKNN